MEEPLQFDSYAGRVAHLIRAGKSFEMIERSIVAWPLNEEERATLWLYAWSLQSNARQRQPGRKPVKRSGTD